MSDMRAALMRQFGNPTGPLGRVAGWIMAARPSNRARVEKTLALLGLAPGQRVLELGFGPGLGVALAAAQVGPTGQVVGLERSALMLEVASRRNAAALAGGQVRLLAGAAAVLAAEAGPFDRAFAVNVFMFWEDPVAELRAVRALLRPGGQLALTWQPRARGATGEDTRRAGERLGEALAAAGFEAVRVEVLPVGWGEPPAACALGRRPAAPQDARA